MTRREFTPFQQVLLNEAIAICAAKGHDYAGDEDVLANFKRNGKALDLPPAKVLLVYMNKHADAINTFVRELGSGREPSEPIRSRILDNIVYLTLLAALLDEEVAGSSKMAPDELDRALGRTSSPVLTPEDDGLAHDLGWAGPGDSRAILEGDDWEQVQEEDTD